MNAWTTFLIGVFIGCALGVVVAMRRAGAGAEAQRSARRPPDTTVGGVGRSRAVRALRSCTDYLAHACGERRVGMSCRGLARGPSKRGPQGSLTLPACDTKLISDEERQALLEAILNAEMRAHGQDGTAAPVARADRMVPNG